MFLNSKLQALQDPTTLPICIRCGRELKSLELGLCTNCEDEMDDMVELSGVMLVKETNTAIRVSDDTTGEEWWLPKSRIKYDDTAVEGDFIVIELPQWLAENAGIEF